MQIRNDIQFVQGGLRVFIPLLRLQLPNGVLSNYVVPIGAQEAGGEPPQQPEIKSVSNAAGYSTSSDHALIPVRPFLITTRHRAHMMNRQQRRSVKPSIFADAVACHQAGQVAQAERLYRRILSNEPTHIAALSNLGLAVLTQGRPDDAVTMLRRAVALRPDNAQAAMNLAEALRAAGALEDALGAYRRAATLVPPSAVLENNIGVVLSALGRPDDAMASFRFAARIDPAYAEAYANQGRLLLQGCSLQTTDQAHIGDTQLGAVAAFRQACALRPQAAEYLADLGLALSRAGDLEGAEAACRAAIAHDPRHIPGQVNLAHVLILRRRYTETVAVCQAALAIAPDIADLHCSLAAASVMIGALDDAGLHARRALRLQPRHVAAWFNLGMTLERQGALNEAVAAQRQALTIDPTFAGAELKMAHALLAQGDYANGWRHFEARWRTGEHVSNFQHLMRQPRWRGEPLEGRTILLHWEQGLGDTLQLLRYVPMVVARGGRVLLIVQQPLRTLVPDWPGVTLIDDPAEVPRFDVQCSLFSLPSAFNTTHATIPAPIPYVRAAPATHLAGSLQDWGRDDDARKIRIGLVWAGSVDHKGDAARSINLPALAPLLAVPGMRFYSLQRDLRAGDAEWMAGPGRHITHLGTDLHDFGDTSAALAAMDLLITVDTSACHLAGALGLPAWLLLPASPEWRWAPDGAHSSWYPSVRLIRQDTAGDWGTLIERVASELSRLRLGQQDGPS